MLSCEENPNLNVFNKQQHLRLSLWQQKEKVWKIRIV